MKFGKRTAVTCAVVDGDSPFTFSWFKDGENIREDLEYFSIVNGEYSSMLTLSKLGAHSNGNYTCKVINSFGSAEKFDILQVKGNLFFNSIKKLIIIIHEVMHKLINSLSTGFLNGIDNAKT